MINSRDNVRQIGNSLTSYYVKYNRIQFVFIESNVRIPKPKKKKIE